VRVSERLHNLLQDCFYIPDYLMVPKPEHPIALLHQERSPFQVRFYLRSVLATIDFHNQTVLRAAQVGYEAADRMLPPELGVTHLSVAQPCPQPLLGLSLVTTQTAGSVSQC
jgi:hypothetical protein